MTVSNSPADLFVELWLRCSRQLPSAISIAPRPNTAFAKNIRGALNLDDGQKSYDLISKLLSSMDSQLLFGCELVVLDEIDKLFYLIHPRNFNMTGGHFLASKIPRWLKGLKIKRLGGNAYASIDDLSLIARGPLSRLPRAESASSAVCFADRFSALTVVPDHLKLNTVPVKISYQVKGGAADGASPGGTLGSEKVTFIPVAIKEADLDITERDHCGNIFVQYCTSSAVNVPEKIMGALKGAGFSDIAIAPELVCSEVDAGKLSDLIKCDAGTHRLLVSGSGFTVDSHNGQHWNETQVVNGIGTVVWRQRKIWPAGLSRLRALEYKLSDPGAGLSMEDNCSGNEVCVVDLDGLGRCVILICQDLEADPLAGDLIRNFQPDWVFTPILDRGIEAGRWVHQKAFALSALSPARFIVSCSTALADRAKITGEIACGMAVGPKDSFGVDEGRVHALAYLSGNAEFATLKWRDKWKFTLLTST